MEHLAGVDDEISQDADLGALTTTTTTTTTTKDEEQQQSDTEVPPRSKQESSLDKVDNLRQIDRNDDPPAPTGGTTMVAEGFEKKVVGKGKGKLEDLAISELVDKDYMKKLLVGCGEEIANTLDQCVHFGLEHHKLIALLLEMKEGFEGDTPIASLITTRVDKLLPQPARVKKAEKEWENPKAKYDYVYGRNTEESKIFGDLHNQAKALEAAITTDNKEVSELKLAYDNHKITLKDIITRIDPILFPDGPPKLEMTRVVHENEKTVEESGEKYTKGIAAMGVGVVAAVLTFLFCFRKTWNK